MSYAYFAKTQSFAFIMNSEEGEGGEEAAICETKNKMNSEEEAEEEKK